MKTTMPWNDRRVQFVDESNIDIGNDKRVESEENKIDLENEKPLTDDI